MFIVLIVVMFHKYTHMSNLPNRALYICADYVCQLHLSNAVSKNTRSEPFEGFSLRGLSHSLSQHTVTVWLSHPCSILFTLPSYNPEELTVLSELVFLLLFCSFYYHLLEKG